MRLDVPVVFYMIRRLFTLQLEVIDGCCKEME